MALSKTAFNRALVQLRKFREQESKSIFEMCDYIAKMNFDPDDIIALAVELDLTVTQFQHRRDVGINFPAESWDRKNITSSAFVALLRLETEQERRALLARKPPRGDRWTADLIHQEITRMRAKPLPELAELARPGRNFEVAPGVVIRAELIDGYIEVSWPEAVEVGRIRRLEHGTKLRIPYEV